MIHPLLQLHSTNRWSEIIKQWVSSLIWRITKFLSHHQHHLRQHQQLPGLQRQYTMNEISAQVTPKNAKGGSTTVATTPTKSPEKRITVPWDVEKPVVSAHLLLLLWSIAPLLFPVPTNLNIVVSASLTVYCGCFRSVKATAPTESMTKGEAMRFPIVGSAVLFSLFLAFKFLPKVCILWVSG